MLDSDAHSKFRDGIITLLFFAVPFAVCVATIAGSIYVLAEAIPQWVLMDRFFQVPPIFRWLASIAAAGLVITLKYRGDAVDKSDWRWLTPSALAATLITLSLMTLFGHEMLIVLLLLASIIMGLSAKLLGYLWHKSREL